MNGDRTLRGTVTRITAEGVFVEVPRLGLGVEFGPCEVAVPPVARSAIGGYADAYTQQDSDAAGGLTDRTWRAHDHPDFGQGGSSSLTLEGHRHAINVGQAFLRAKDRVLVTTIDGVLEDLVIIGRLP